MLETLRQVLGDRYVLTGPDRGRWLQEWTGRYTLDPIAVVRPSSTAEVAEVVRIAHASGTAIVPVSGNTGLTGGTSGQDVLMLSVDRLNQITDIDPEGRTATVGAGVILSQLHDAVAEKDLLFPLTFGARGSAMIGGVLATNAGGSNVLRYGNTRDLCLGLEVVMADGQVMDLMSRLHKDNSGLNLKHLIIGSEGTLGIITAAVVKLFPRPLARATAMVAPRDLSVALGLLHRLQSASGNAVDAFEFMPRSFIDGHLSVVDGAKPPFEKGYEVNILVELGLTQPRDAELNEDGAIRGQDMLTDILSEMMQDGVVLDAVIAQNEAQRTEMWARREAAAEVAYARSPSVDGDVAVALTDVETFLKEATRRLTALDPGADDMTVAHLGDGNIHYSGYPTRNDPVLKDQISEMLEDLVQEMRGSFSAEHGVGRSKLASMRRRKDPVAIAAMRAIKDALDPRGILNPGKMFPD